MAVERDDVREVSGDAEERSGRSGGGGGVGKEEQEKEDLRPGWRICWRQDAVVEILRRWERASGWQGP
jgi:hypothetical protein